MDDKEREWWENAIKNLKELNKELKEDNDRWEQEEILKGLYHENP